MQDLMSLFSDGDEDQAPVATSSGNTLADFFAPTQETKSASAVMALLEDVMQAGDVAPREWLQDRGHGDGALLAALTKPTGDKRKQPLLRAHNINGVHVVALTSAGNTALGFPHKREKRPTPSTINHVLAPLQIRKKIEATNPHYRGAVELRVETTGHGITEWQRSLSASAWGRLNSGTFVDTGGGVGQLTKPEGAPRPDALIYEEWAEGNPQARANAWTEAGPRAWEEATDEARFVILTHILEVETSEKRTHALTAKVRRLNAALDLGGADTVIWAVDSDNVAQRIRSAVRAENTGQDDARHRIVLLAHLTGKALVPPIKDDHVAGWWVTEFIR